MKILSIGNSFSVDAQRYLYDLALLEGENLDCANLYIGGCSLETHWNNAENDLPNYEYWYHGMVTYLDEAKTQVRKSTIREALQEGGWDVITFQQASHFSGMYDTYQPYLERLAAYVRQYAPQAQFWMHETWAYEMNSPHPAFPNYECDQALMYQKLKDAYTRAAQSIQAQMIPSGDVIQALRALPDFDYAHGGPSLCRDGFHMSYALGRYTLAVTWYACMTGKIPTQKTLPLDHCCERDLALFPLIRETVAKIVLS